MSKKKNKDAGRNKVVEASELLLKACSLARGNRPEQAIQMLSEFSDHESSNDVMDGLAKAALFLQADDMEDMDEGDEIDKSEDMEDESADEDLEGEEDEDEEEDTVELPASVVELLGLEGKK